MRYPVEPRISPLDSERQTEGQRALIAGGTAPNFLSTLARHEVLFNAWLAFSGQLVVRGRLSPRDRELVILRVALRTSTRYVWAQHVKIAATCGVTQDEIDALPTDRGAWREADAALLDAVDELTAQDCVSDATWETLAKTYDESQLIELLVLAGLYRMVGGFMNSVGLQPEPGLAELGQR